jgi:hypothetical protein
MSTPLTPLLSTSDSISSLLFSADGRYAYVVTTDIAGCSTLQAYAVTGAPAPSLTPIGAAIPHQQTIQSMALNPAGTLLVAVAQLAVFNYTVGTDGTLTASSEISGPPYPPSCLFWLLFNTAGTFLYGPTSINTTSDSLAIYPVGPTGVTQANPASTVSLQGTVISMLMMGGYLITAQYANDSTQPCFLQVFSPDATTGSLTLVQTTTLVGSIRCCDMKLCGSGAFVYAVLNPYSFPPRDGLQFGVGTAQGFVLNSDGTLTAIPGSPFTLSNPAASGAVSMAALPMESLAWCVSNSGYSDALGNLQWLSAAQDGSLTAGASFLTDVSGTIHHIFAHPSSKLVLVDVVNSTHTLYACPTRSPLLQTTVQVTPQGVVLSCTLDPAFSAGYTFGAYYSTTPDPGISASSAATTTAGTNSFQVTIPLSAITFYTPIYIRAYAQPTATTAQYLGEVLTFSVNYPVVTQLPSGPQKIGATIQIVGQGFDVTNAAANGVFFTKPGQHVSALAQTIQGTTASATLTVTIPSGAFSGSVFVQANSVNGLLSATPLLIQQTPVITASTPAAGLGATITLQVQYLDPSVENVQIQFAGVDGPVSPASISGNTLTVVVPAATQTGMITVACNGVQSTGVSFIVQQPPVITEVDDNGTGPNTGFVLVGQHLILFGKNFRASTGAKLPGETLQVFFGDLQASYTGSTPITISAVVPAGIRSSTVTVIANGVSSAPFTFSTVVLRAVSNVSVGNNTQPIKQAAYGNGQFGFWTGTAIYYGADPAGSFNNLPTQDSPQAFCFDGLGFDLIGNYSGNGKTLVDTYTQLPSHSGGYFSTLALTQIAQIAPNGVVLCAALAVVNGITSLYAGETISTLQLVHQAQNVLTFKRLLRNGSQAVGIGGRSYAVYYRSGTRQWVETPLSQGVTDGVWDAARSQFVAFGQSVIATSQTGVIWTNASLPSGLPQKAQTVVAMAAFTAGLVAITSTGDLWVSKTGANWSLRELGFVAQNSVMSIVGDGANLCALLFTNQSRVTTIAPVPLS